MAGNKIKWYVNSAWNDSTREFRDANGKVIADAVWGVNVFAALPSAKVVEACDSGTEITISVQGNFDSLSADWNGQALINFGISVKIVSHGAKIAGAVTTGAVPESENALPISFVADSKSTISGSRTGSVWTAVSSAGSITFENGIFTGAVVGSDYDTLTIRSGVTLRSYSGSDPLVTVCGGVSGFESVTIEGTVFGNVTTSEYSYGYGVAFGAGGRVVGDIRTTALTLRSGAVLDGDLILTGEVVSDGNELLAYGGRITGSVIDEKESSSVRFSYGTTYVNGTLSAWEIQVDPYAVLSVGGASSATPAITTGNLVVNNGIIDFQIARSAKNELVSLLSGAFEGDGGWRIGGKLANDSIFKFYDAEGAVAGLVYCAAPETSRKTLFVHADFAENYFDLTENQTGYVLSENKLLSLEINAFHTVAEALETAVKQTETIRVTGGALNADLEFFGKRAEIVGGTFNLTSIYGADSSASRSVRTTNILIDGTGNTIALANDVTIFAYGAADRSDARAVVTLRGLDASAMSSTDARFDVDGTHAQTKVILEKSDAGTISDTISVTMTDSAAESVILSEHLELSNSSVDYASGILQISAVSGENCIGSVQSSSLAVLGGTLTLDGYNSNGTFYASLTDVLIRSGATFAVNCTDWLSDDILSYTGSFRNLGTLDFSLDNLFSGNDLNAVGLVRYAAGGRLAGDLKNFGKVTVNGHLVTLAVSGDTLTVASVRANLETIYADSVLASLSTKESAMLLGDRRYLLNENAFGSIDEAFDQRNWDTSTSVLHVGNVNAAAAGAYFAFGDLFARGKRLEIVNSAIAGSAESFTLYGGGKSGQTAVRSEISIVNSTLTGNLTGGNEKRSSICVMVTAEAVQISGNIALNTSNGKSSVTINGLSSASSVGGSVSGGIATDSDGVKYNSGTFTASGAVTVSGAVSGFKTILIDGGENVASALFTTISGGGSFTVSAQKVMTRAGGSLAFANGSVENLGSGSADGTGTFSVLNLENATVSGIVTGGGQERRYDIETGALKRVTFTASGTASLDKTSVSGIFAGYREVTANNDSLVNGFLLGGSSQWIEDTTGYATDLILENVGLALVSRTASGSLTATGSTFGDPVIGFQHVTASGDTNFYRGIFGGSESFSGGFIGEKNFEPSLESVTESRISTHSRTSSGSLLLQDSIILSGGAEPFMDTVSGYTSVILQNATVSGTLAGGSRLDKYTEVYDAEREAGKSTSLVSQWISNGSLIAENCQFFDGESTAAGFRSVAITGSEGLYHLDGGDRTSRTRSENLWSEELDLIRNKIETTSHATGNAVLKKTVFGVSGTDIPSTINSFSSLFLEDVSAYGNLNISGGERYDFENIVSDLNGTIQYGNKAWRLESSGSFSAIRSIFNSVSGYASTSMKGGEAAEISGGVSRHYWKLEQSGNETFTAESNTSGSLLLDGTTITNFAVGYASARVVNSNVSDLISMRLAQSDLDQKSVSIFGDYTASGVISISEKYRINGNSEYLQTVSAKGKASIIHSEVTQISGYAEVTVSEDSTIFGMIASTQYYSSMTGLSLSGNIRSKEIDYSDGSVFYRMTCSVTGTLSVKDSTLAGAQVLGFRKIVFSGGLAENAMFSGGDTTAVMAEDGLTVETTSSGTFIAKNGAELIACTFTDLARAELTGVTVSAGTFIQSNLSNNSSISFKNVILSDSATTISGSKNVTVSQMLGTATLGGIDFSEDGGNLNIASGFLRCDALSFYEGENDTIRAGQGAVFSWCVNDFLNGTGVDRLTGSGTILTMYEDALDGLDFGGTHRWFYGEGGENSDDDQSLRTELTLTRGGRTENWLGANGGTGDFCDTVDFLRINLASGSGVKLNFDESEVTASCSFDGGLTWQDAASGEKIALAGASGVDLRFELIGGAADGVNSTFYKIAAV